MSPLTAQRLERKLKQWKLERANYRVELIAVEQRRKELQGLLQAKEQQVKELTAWLKDSKKVKQPCAYISVSHEAVRQWSAIHGETTRHKLGQSLPDKVKQCCKDGGTGVFVIPGTRTVVTVKQGKVTNIA